MKIHKKFLNVKAFFNLFVALVFAGCVTQTSQVKSNIPPQPEKTVAEKPDSKPTPVEAEEKPARPPEIENPQKIAAIPETEKEKEKEPVSPPGPAENIIPATAPKPDKKKPISPSEPTEKPIPAPALEPAKKSDQELLDSALEFCNASNDFWERGDLENALDALDQAYSLVLEVVVL